MDEKLEMVSIETCFRKFCCKEISTQGPSNRVYEHMSFENMEAIRTGLWG